jgi:hypothetical protein
MKEKHIPLWYEDGNETVYLLELDGDDNITLSKK